MPTEELTPARKKRMKTCQEKMSRENVTIPAKRRVKSCQEYLPR